MADIAIRGINSGRESHVHRAFEKIVSMQYRLQDLPLGPSDMFSRSEILLDTFLLWGSATYTSGACGGEEGTT
jgi:hypothetical protein